MRRNLIIIGAAFVFMLTIAFISDSNVVKSAEKKVEKKGYLGVSVEPLTRHLKRELKADYGIVITSIEEDSPADKDGLMEDDVIQKVNDVKIRRPSTLTRVIRKIKPGEKANIGIIRDGKEKTITVTVDKLKSSRSYAFYVAPNINMFRWCGGGAYLGVKLHELNKDLAPYFGVKEDEGVLILEVEDDSPAKDAGLKSGDVVIRLDGESVSNPEDVQEIISDLEEDDVVKIEVIRNNKKMILETKLAEREGYQNFIFSPDKRIKELEFKSKGERFIDRLIPEINRYKRRPQIKIEKKKSIPIDMI